MINRNNAEAFFLDYYEGNLSKEQVAELFAFLKANPDLRETFETFGDVALDDSEIRASDSESRVPDFSFLKKEPVADEHAQAEQWMVDTVDGVISKEDRDSLEKYFEKYPAKRKELELLEKTILRSDAKETFGDLSSLKRNVGITAENFPDFAIAHVEGTISDYDKKKLEAFIAAHPEFANELAQFQSTKLVPSDPGMDFSFLKKSSLVVTEDNIMELLVAKSEGELSAHEEAAVDEYIARFPEYKLELDLIARTKLQPDTSEIFEDKDQLKRQSTIINESNFEQYLVSATEGLLNREELNAFNAFVSANPKYRKSIAISAATRLQPDMSIVYEDKESLKRKQRGGTIWWSINMRYAAAAVVVIILGIYIFMKFGANTTNIPSGEVAGKNVNPDNIIPEWNIPESSKTTNDKLASNAQNSDFSDQAVWDPREEVQVEKVQVASNPSPVVVVESPFVPATIIAERIAAKPNDAVTYSDAYYNAAFDQNAPAKPTPADEYISPGQYAMRWMKDKIDGPDPEVIAGNNEQPDGRPEDNNVDGMDITQSAVNRVGSSTANGNISMDQREDGTYLHLWNYSVRVSSAD